MDNYTRRCTNCGEAEPSAEQWELKRVVVETQRITLLCDGGHIRLSEVVDRSLAETETAEVRTLYKCRCGQKYTRREWSDLEVVEVEGGD